MITGSEIYWITRFDGIRALLLGLFFLFELFSLLVLATGGSMLNDSEKGGKKESQGATIFVAGIIMFFLFFLIPAARIFVPSTKEMCAIKVIPVIVNNENVQELPNEIVGLAREWIEELKPKKGDTK